MDAGVEVPRTTQSDSELARPHPQDIRPEGLALVSEVKSREGKVCRESARGGSGTP